MAKRSSDGSSEDSREALQSKSHNSMKRHLNDSNDSISGSAKKQAIPAKAAHPIPQDGTSVDSYDSAGDVLPPPVCITGHYAITISELTSHHKFDTSSYAFTLFRYVGTETSQVYAEFKFDHLEGIMRLVPQEVFDAKGETKWDSADFVRACKLPRDVYPSPAREKWLMRWRGEDGGMRLNEHVGGEAWNAASTFDFKFNTSTPENGVGLNFRVVFAYDCKLFSFSGTKLRALDEGFRPVSPSSIEEKWNMLDNPAWYEDGSS
jgi:hypothetical protein